MPLIMPMVLVMYGHGLQLIRIQSLFHAGALEAEMHKQEKSLCRI